jgi:hypothetical protein
MLREVLGWVTTEMCQVCRVMLEGVASSCGLGKCLKGLGLIITHGCVKYRRTLQEKRWIRSATLRLGTLSVPASLGLGGVRGLAEGIYFARVLYLIVCRSKQRLVYTIPFGRCYTKELHLYTARRPSEKERQEEIETLVAFFRVNGPILLCARVPADSLLAVKEDPTAYNWRGRQASRRREIKAEEVMLKEIERSCKEGQYYYIKKCGPKV